MRISSGLTGIERQLLGALAQANASAALATLRLATGQRVNRPSDDPAAFLRITSLEREQSAVQTAIANVDGAANTAATLQLNLESVRTQLDTIRTALLADEDQSLTSAERDAQQAIINAALDEINDVAGAAINGRRILDGSAAYSVSGRNSAEVTGVQVYSARATAVTGEVTAAATRATLTYTGASGEVTDAATFTLSGRSGNASISVTAGQTLASAAAAINAESHLTGVTASVVGDTLTFTSVDYGSEATAGVSVASGTFAVAGGGADNIDEGTDAAVTINGSTPTVVRGNRVTFASNGLHVDLELAAGFTGTIDTMTISAGGSLQFALGTDTRQTTLSVPSVLTVHLGGASGRLSDLASGGNLDGLGANTSQAIRVVDEALARLDVIQGQIDGFAGITVETSAQLLEDWDVELAAALETENGIDDAAELLKVERAEMLAENTLAALAILQQQQKSMVSLLQTLAGLK